MASASIAGARETRLVLAGAVLGIVCGGGALPLRIADAAAAAGLPVFMIGIEGEADPAIARFPHAFIKWGEVGKLFALLRDRQCRDLVIIGHVRRPKLKNVHFDFGALRNLPRFLSFLVGGDDRVLSGIVRFLEKKGIHVHGAHQIAPDLLVREGPIGRHAPDRQARDDIAVGLRAAAALGAADIGQGVVVENGQVLAVEAAEGTDAMLARCAGLRRGGARARSGVLVKRAKPGQELRVDMPTIGAATVAAAADAGLAGIAVEAGRTILTDQAEIVRAADAAGLFVVAVAADDNE